jgi:hypothetical protein
VEGALAESDAVLGLRAGRAVIDEPVGGLTGADLERVLFT